MKLSMPNATPRNPIEYKKATEFVGRALFTALAAIFIISATACEEQSKFDEAVEEVQDEAGDLKKNIKDEIDDHS